MSQKLRDRRSRMCPHRRAPPRRWAALPTWPLGHRKSPPRRRWASGPRWDWGCYVQSRFSETGGGTRQWRRGLERDGVLCQPQEHHSLQTLYLWMRVCLVQQQQTFYSRCRFANWLQFVVTAVNFGRVYRVKLTVKAPSLANTAWSENWNQRRQQHWQHKAVCNVCLGASKHCALCVLSWHHNSKILTVNMKQRFFCCCLWKRMPAAHKFKAHV